MKDLISYIYEGQVDALKDVKIIRHYTTGSGLRSILKNGYIEARESEGDDDWKAYKLFDTKVVSFHDQRTDPEWHTFIENNKRGISMEGHTPTLALHMKKLCACIEIDYDKLPELMQQKTHLLNIYGQKAEDFANYWNYYVDDIVKDKNGFVAWYSCRKEILQLCKDIAEGNDEEMKEALDTLHNEYTIIRKWDEEKAKPIIKEFEKIFRKHYPQKDLYEEEKDYSGNKQRFICNEIRRYFMGLPYVSGSESTCEGIIKGIKKVDKEIKESQERVKFYSTRNFKRFEDDEIEEFKEIVIKFDVIGAIKMLKNHGWRFGDSELLSFCRYRVQQNNGKYTDGSIGIWIDNLLKSKSRIINADIEIRIASNVEINKDNCKIIIFDGICDATKQESLKKLPAKYYKQYNIEHIKSEKTQ